ncbi:hypothetical protein RQP46_006361 [Phenoliferia psychrophenolica]
MSPVSRRTMSPARSMDSNVRDSAQDIELESTWSPSFSPSLSPLPYSLDNSDRRDSQASFAPLVGPDYNRVRVGSPLPGEFQREEIQMIPNKESWHEPEPTKWQRSKARKVWRLAMLPIILAILGLIAFGITYGVMKINHSQAVEAKAEASSSQASFSASFSSSQAIVESISSAAFMSSLLSKESASSASDDHGRRGQGSRYLGATECHLFLDIVVTAFTNKMLD